MAVITALPGVALANGFCTLPSGANWSQWIEKQEKAGGHTLKCHVGVSEQGLIHRIENQDGHRGDACQSNGQAASAWSGEHALITALKSIRNKLNINVPPDTKNIITGTAKNAIGLIVRRGTKKKTRNESCRKSTGSGTFFCHKTRKFKVVLKHPEGTVCHMVTAYPVP